MLTILSQAITEEEVSQSTGGPYEELNLLMNQADEDVAAAEEDGDDAKCTQISRYKQYLQRCKKSWVIEERAHNISEKLGAALKGPSSEDCVEIIHTSTSNYMAWIKSDKINFKDQPLYLLRLRVFPWYDGFCSIYQLHKT
jgi:hypothetical protein